MSPSPVVSNTSPILALRRIGHLGLLEALFSTVLVPSGVIQELLSEKDLPPWLIERPLAHPIRQELQRASLGKGEREAISLALEVNARWVLLDDRPARRQAGALGLPIVGTLGILLHAKRAGSLPLVQPALAALSATGFRVASEIYDQVLLEAGEAPTETEPSGSL